MNVHTPVRKSHLGFLIHFCASACCLLCGDGRDVTSWVPSHEEVPRVLPKSSCRLRWRLDKGTCKHVPQDPKHSFDLVPPYPLCSASIPSSVPCLLMPSFLTNQPHISRLACRSKSMSMPADPHLPSLATGTLRQVTVNARRNEKTAPQARAARHLRPLVQHCLSRFCLHPCFQAAPSNSQ